jgi:hypothetical protein
MMTTRRAARWLLVVASLLGTIGTTTTPVTAQVPAGASGTGNVTRLAFLEWTERDRHHLSYWRLDARQMVTAWTWFGVAHANTQMSLSELRCPLVRDRKRGCSTGKNLSWRIDPLDFEFDPLLGRAEIVYGRNDERITWTATGDYEPMYIRRAHRRYRADPGSIWGTANTTGVVAIGRDASVRGSVGGRDLRDVTGEAGLVLWTGASGSGGLCLASKGELC